jgi:hypothetical protein
MGLLEHVSFRGGHGYVLNLVGLLRGVSEDDLQSHYSSDNRVLKSHCGAKNLSQNTTVTVS